MIVLLHLVRRRLDGEIAFAVEADRTVVQVRRADAQEHVVDDDELGMDQHLAFPALAIGDDRVIDPQPVVVIAFAQAADQPVAVGAHHQLFGPAMGFVGLDDDDLRPVGIGEMALEHVADMTGAVMYCASM